MPADGGPWAGAVMLFACRFFSFLVRVGVPFLVLSYRLVLASRSCLVGWRSRVGVGVSLLVPSCRPVRVSAFRGVGRIVLVLSCCAVFVSSCSRAVSSFLVVPSLPFVFVPSVVSGGGSWGRVVGVWRGGGCVVDRFEAVWHGVAWRYACRGDVASAIRRCRVVWRGVP